LADYSCFLKMELCHSLLSAKHHSTNHRTGRTYYTYLWEIHPILPLVKGAPYEFSFTGREFAISHCAISVDRFTNVCCRLQTL
jgi:hypothetical protein